MEKKKVFILGIDGATFDIIKPLIAEDKLPNLAKMMQNGSHGDLTSTIPPNSSVAWTSFATGKNPGKHGVYYFREKKVGSYERPLISSRSIMAKTLWKMLSEQGKRVGVVNFPVAYPPEEINGYLISGLLAPDRKSVFTYPPSLHFDLMKEFGDYPLDNEAEMIYHSSGDELAAFQHLIYSTKKVMEATFYLMEKFQWDVFITVPTIVDRVQHIAWKYILPEYKEKNPESCKKFEKVIETGYRIIDEEIKSLKARFDNDTTFIVLSDHGFGPISYKFYINRWLRRLGLLNLKKNAVMKSKFQAFTKSLIKRSLIQLGKRVGMPLGTLKKIEALAIANVNSDEMHTFIDWSKTKAFSSWTSGEEIVIINLKGRESQGIVMPGEEYEKLRDFIIEKLRGLQGDEKEKLIDRAFKREEIYFGDYVYMAPDIQFTTSNMSVQPRGELMGDTILIRPDDFSPALHRMNGVLLIEGEGIKQNFKINNAQIIDLAPTILYMLGLPIPKDMDGKVLTSSFKEDYLKANPIQISEAESVSFNDKNDQSAYTTGEEKQLEDALKGLGYI